MFSSEALSAVWGAGFTMMTNKLVNQQFSGSDWMVRNKTGGEEVVDGIRLALSRVDLGDGAILVYGLEAGQPLPPKEEVRRSARRAEARRTSDVGNEEDVQPVERKATAGFKL